MSNARTGRGPWIFWDPAAEELGQVPRVATPPPSGGLGLHVLVAGAWKDVPTAYVLVAGAWKAVTTANVISSGAWKAGV